MTDFARKVKFEKAKCLALALLMAAQFPTHDLRDRDLHHSESLGERRLGNVAGRVRRTDLNDLSVGELASAVAFPGEQTWYAPRVVGVPPLTCFRPRARSIPVSPRTAVRARTATIPVASGTAIFGIHVSHVVGRRPEKQVCRSRFIGFGLHARRVVAVMANKEAILDVAVLLDPSSTVRESCFSEIADEAVFASRLRPHPQPAWTEFWSDGWAGLVDVQPEANFEVFWMLALCHTSDIPREREEWKVGGEGVLVVSEWWATEKGLT